jgi:hypothetical protein
MEQHMTYLFRKKILHVKLRGLWQISINLIFVVLCFRDISWNQLTGPIPSGQLASNITTMYKLRTLTKNSCHFVFSSVIDWSLLTKEAFHFTLTVVQRSFPQPSQWFHSWKFLWPS